MIIGLVGYAQSGKDSVAEVLTNVYGFKRKAFADNIRHILYDIDYKGAQFVVDTIGWERAKKMPAIREGLQKLGVSAREILGPDIWVSSVLRTLDASSDYVFTDVRFENEVTALKLMGAEIWRIERPGIGPVNDHISEVELKDYQADRTLLNEGTKEDLVMLVQTRMRPLLDANQTN